MSDYLWTVVKPRNSERDAIDKMNTMLLAFDPNTPARYDDKCREIARGLLEAEFPSFAEVVRRGMEITPP